jgi:hypothetical protein
VVSHLGKGAPAGVLPPNYLPFLGQDIRCALRPRSRSCSNLRFHCVFRVAIGIDFYSRIGYSSLLEGG